MAQKQEKSPKKIREHATSTAELVEKYEKSTNPVTRSVYRMIIGKRIGLIEDE